MRRSAVLLSVVALLVWGCGGSSGAGGDADPAKVLPAGAIAYGEQRDNAEAVLGKVLQTDDPGAEVVRLLERSGDSDVDYEKDVEPWLGKRVGLAVLPQAGGSSDLGYVAAIATTDPGEAEAFVKHQRDSDGYATVAGDFVLVADTRAALARAKRLAADGGHGLADAKRFSSAVGDLPDERLGALWVDPARFGELAASGTGGNPLANALLQSSFGRFKPMTAVLTAGEDTATVETRGGLGGLATAGDASEILRSLPGDAWAALGVPDLGSSVGTALSRLGGAFGGTIIAQQLEQGTGLRLQQDVLSWIGDAAVYVTGDTPATVTGALVVHATDAGKAATALPRLVGAARQQLGAPFSPVSVAGADQAFAAAMPGAPGPVVLARAGDRVVLALGEATARQALDPSSTLGGTDLLDRAAGALGGYPPSFVASIAPLLRFGDPGEARQYLERLDLAAAGAKGDRSRVTVRVR